MPHFENEVADYDALLINSRKVRSKNRHTEILLTRCEFHQVEVRVGRNLLLETIVLRRGVDLLFDTTVEHVVLSTDPVQGVARPWGRLNLAFLDEFLPLNFCRLNINKKLANLYS